MMKADLSAQDAVDLIDVAGIVRAAKKVCSTAICPMCTRYDHECRKSTMAPTCLMGDLRRALHRLEHQDGDG